LRFHTQHLNGGINLVRHSRRAPRIFVYRRHRRTEIHTETCDVKRSNTYPKASK